MEQVVYVAEKRRQIQTTSTLSTGPGFIVPSVHIRYPVVADYVKCLLCGTPTEAISWLAFQVVKFSAAAAAAVVFDGEIFFTLPRTCLVSDW